MNGRVVNLRMARKQRDRARKRAEGDAQAAKHGRTKGETAQDDEARARAEAHLDGHRLDDDG